MTKILAFDLGSSSIGYSLRDTDKNGENIIDQLVLYGSIIFSPGMADNGVSNAAERTKHRSSRHLYRVRRYRIWETLATLIEFDCCPLSKEDLDKWKTYDKKKSLTRQYPVDAVEFEKWIRMNPYELREELATQQLDFTKEENRFKLGRALYHIAQRRGFRSSKGETLKEQEKDINENPAEEIRIDSDLLKKSEEKKSKKLVAYMEEHSLPTVGKAFANLINDKIRVRASEYQAVRSQYRDEIEYIFNFQKGLDANGEFFRRIYSTGNDGTIFYQNPIRSQKGQVGKCTLEPAKPRCPISHPEYEKYRAFSFINNIKYRKSIDEDWQTLTASQKIKLYKEKFLLVNDFEFAVIRKWIEKEIGLPKDISLSKENGTINYDDRTNVSACPVSGRLKSVFGDNWEDYVYQTAKTRKDKEGKEHTVTYTIEDIWHVCFSYDDEDAVSGFAKSIGLDAAQEKKFLNLWMNIPQGYAMLSLKAIRNINRFLVPKENKDKAIRQKHLWQMELDYWKDKLSRFTMTEVSEGFKHRQLNDTRLITKYAYHYLKSVFDKVDVQKGIITSEFRKIFGFPVKTRDNHSHHTIDATILTLIPVASRRDEMLRLFYEIQENKKLNIDTKEKEKQLEGLIKSCRIGKTVGITKHIENNILVKYVSKDRALTPAIRNKRVGGKVVWERNEKGEILIDINGKKIPKYKLTGDCIRGELHKASFYGAIRQSKRETEKKKEQEEDASYETSYNDISYVIRRKLSDFKDLNELHKVIVDEHLFNIIKKQCEGKDFKDVCNEGFYMPNCNNQIRHIRCYTYDVKNPLHIRKQTYLSKKGYKQTFHVKVGDLYAMCRYHNVNKKMKYGIVKLFDISKSRKKGYEIPEILDDEYYLDAILRPGMQVILYKDQSDYDNLLRKPLNIKLLSERLYIIERFEGDNIINLKKHLCSSSFKETGRGKAINLKSFDNGLPEKIRQSIRQLNYLLESVDFKINLEGKIVFRNKN